MINLLPREIKQEITFARYNVLLIKVIAFTSIALIGIGLTIGVGSLYMDRTIASLEQRVEAAEAELNIDSLSKTEKELKEISSNVKLVVSVLEREVLFSKLIQEIGSTIPPGVQLLGLTLDQLEGAISLSAQATDFETATQLQLNLADESNKVFAAADIESISCIDPDDAREAAEASGSPVVYRCSVSVKALFADENPFLFLNYEEDPEEQTP